MEKSFSTSSNKGLLIFSIATFLISWYPNIEPKYKLYLLIASIIMLCAIFSSTYLNAVDKLETKIEKIEKRFDKIEDLINIKNDITLLKKEIFKNE